jgi:acyl-coenzyme A thioesterase PaaI-like protein
MSPAVALYAAPTAFQQHLGLTIALDPGGVAVRMTARPDLCVAEDHLALGVLATVADCAGGMLALRTIEPGWTATMTLSVHRAGPARDPRIEGRARLVRRRRGSMVLAVDVVDGTGHVVAVATGLFAELDVDGRTSGLDYALQQATPLRPGEDLVASPGPHRPLAEHLGLVTATGTTVLDLHDGVRNTAEALIGGATAVLADTAATTAAARVLGHPVLATDLDLHYIGPGRVGPVTAATKVLADGPGALVDVTAVDAGAADRPVAQAVVRVAAIPA